MEQNDSLIKNALSDLGLSANTNAASGLLKIRYAKRGKDPVDWPPITNFNLTIVNFGSKWVANGSAGRCSFNLEYDKEANTLNILLTETPSVKHAFNYSVDSRIEIQSSDKALYIKWKSNVESTNRTSHNIMSGSSLLMTS